MQLRNSRKKERGEGRKKSSIEILNFKFPFRIIRITSSRDEEKDNQDEMEFTYFKEKELDRKLYEIQKETISDLKTILNKTMNTKINSFSTESRFRAKEKAEELPSNADSQKRNAFNFELMLNSLILTENPNLDEIEEKIIEEKSRFSGEYYERIEFDGLFIDKASIHTTPKLPTICVNRAKVDFSSIGFQTPEHFYVFSEDKSSLQLQKDDLKDLDLFFGKKNYLKKENQYWNTVYKLMSILGNFIAKGKNYIDYLKITEEIPQNAQLEIDFMLFYNGGANQFVESLFKKTDQKKLFVDLIKDECQNKIPMTSCHLSINYVTCDSAFIKMQRNWNKKETKLKTELTEFKTEMTKKETEFKTEMTKLETEMGLLRLGMINLIKDLIKEGKNDKEIFEKVISLSFKTTLEEIFALRIYN